jgi:putative transposase
MQRVKRSRLRANVWRELVAKFALSDLTVGAFCSQEGIGTSSFNRWRARLSGNGGAEPPAVRAGSVAPSAAFVDLGTLRSTAATPAERIELRLDLGAGLIVHLVRG